jgi:hypothetical protein
MEQYPHLRPKGVPTSYKGPPMFKEVHVVTLSNEDILTCSCGLGFRYGIPCRHLFVLEPKYDLADIDYRYQVSFSYYGYHPEHQDVTQAFKRRHTREHNGIRRKTLAIQDELPFLSHPAPYTIEYILQLQQSKKPVCWNYTEDEYPPSFNSVGAGHGDFTQESVIGMYDSDGAAITHDDEADLILTVTEESPSSTPETSLDVTDAQLISKFKSCLSCHKSQSSKKALWVMLTTTEQNQRRKLIQDNPALLGNPDDEFQSLHLPLDKAHKSVQHAYSRSRSKRQKRHR